MGNKGKQGRRTGQSILEYRTEDAIGMWDIRSGSGLYPIMLDKRTVLSGHLRFRLRETPYLSITLQAPRLRSCPHRFRTNPYLFRSNSASVTCYAKGTTQLHCAAASFSTAKGLFESIGVYWILILSHNYRLSFPGATQPRVWAVRWDRLNERAESGNR